MRVGEAGCFWDCCPERDEALRAKAKSKDKRLVVRLSLAELEAGAGAHLHPNEHKSLVWDPVLALRELEASAGALLAVLLALLAAGITSDHAAGLERLAQFDVELHECTGDAELDSVGLSVDSATLDRGKDVEGLVDVGDAEGLLGGGALGGSNEVLLELFAVDGELARAGAEEDASDRALAPAGSVVLN